MDSASVTLVSVSEASTAKEKQNREQEGTFNHCLNQKIMLSKLNDYPSTNDLWIWLADAYCYIDSGCLMSAKWILESVVSSKPHAGGQYPDCFEQDELDQSAPT